jgi:phage baseplate assembly protein W
MAVQTRADGYTQTDRKQEIYSDFLADINPHPQTGDIVRYVNENAVKRSIRNLILTNKGERLFQPDFGSDISSVLFEPMDSITAGVLQDYINKAITNHEPRCKLISVDIVANEAKQAYIVNVKYMVINNQSVQQTTVTLYRVRSWPTQVLFFQT